MEGFIASEPSACFSERVARVGMSGRGNTVIERQHAAGCLKGSAEWLRSRFRPKLRTYPLRDLFSAAKKLGDKSG